MNDPGKPRDDAHHLDVAALMSDRRFWLRIGGLVLAIVLGALVVAIVLPIWRPLLWAVLLGAMLAPLNERLVTRLRGRRAVASTITTALTILFFVLPLAALAGSIAAEAAQLLDRMGDLAPRLRAARTLDLSSVSWLAVPFEWLAANAGVTLDEAQDWLVNAARGVLEKLVSSGGSVVLGALGTLASFLVMLFVLFFVLRDGPVVARKTVALLPIEPQRRSRLWRHLIDVTRAVFMGIGLTALVQGILVGIGFAIAQVPGALVFGAVAVVLALIPFVGTALVWVPAAVFLALTGHPGAALFLAAWGILVVGTVDNFLRPFLISGRSDVPTLSVFVGVMGGLQAFGFIGLFLGPIVLGLLIALFRFETEEANAGA